MRTVHTIALGMLILALLWAPAMAQEEQNLVSVDATQTPLVEVLRILAEKSGLNIVTSPDAEDKQISIHLVRTPLEEALNLVVRAAGLGYERVGNSILVALPEDLEEETGLSTHVVDLKYADASEIEPLIKGIAESVTSDKRTGKLVIVASPGMLEEIRLVIDALDVPPVQILLETEVVEVSTDDLMELGIDWSRITKQTVIVTEQQPEPSGPNELPDEMAYGNVGLDNDNIYRQTKALEIALDYLETNGKARILSQSKLATLNNTKAEIHIGDVIPYTVTGYTTTGVLELNVEKERVGVEVDVTPRVSGDGHITAIVEPNVSSIVGWVGPNGEIPWTKERRASTQVRVKDGQTFMIAGLLSEDETRNVQKVPILGDIPLLGYLFQHVRTQIKHSDLIIKITPTVIG